MFVTLTSPKRLSISIFVMEMLKLNLLSCWATNSEVGETGAFFYRGIILHGGFPAYAKVESNSFFMSHTTNR